MADLILSNAKIVTHKEIFDGAVMIKDGRIEAVVRGEIKGASGEVKDLKGKYLLPGAIDVHVHFRTPGQTEKEDFVTGSKAALAGGVTTVLDMPNTRPPIIDQKSLDAKKDEVARKSLVNFGLYVGATMDNLEEVKKVIGACGVKIYMGSSTGNLLVDSKEVLEKFMAEYKGLMVVHAEDEECIKEGMAMFADKVNAGVGEKNEARVHSLIRASECAELAVRTLLHLAKKYGARVHIAHCSTMAELEIIRKFKDKNISVEVTPHHLFLTDKDYEMYGTLIKVNPPIRGLTDQVALWQGIKDGLIDMIATDHAPHLYEEKMKPYAEAPSGVPGVQTMLPLMLNAVNEKKLSLTKLVELTSYNPARLFGLRGKGLIHVGFDADLTVVDLELAHNVDRKLLFSKCGWSPFADWKLKGWPIMTIVNGGIMYEWHSFFGDRPGRLVEN
jgi:dihydroorotase